MPRQRTRKECEKEADRLAGNLLADDTFLPFDFPEEDDVLAVFMIAAHKYVLKRRARNVSKGLLKFRKENEQS